MLESSSFRDLGLMNKFVLYTITFRSNNELRQSEQYTKKRVCQNVHILFFLCTKPRLSQARALLFPKVFVPLGIQKISL